MKTVVRTPGALWMVVTSADSGSSECQLCAATMISLTNGSRLAVGLGSSTMRASPGCAWLWIEAMLSMVATLASRGSTSICSTSRALAPAHSVSSTTASRQRVPADGFAGLQAAKPSATATTMNPRYATLRCDLGGVFAFDMGLSCRCCLLACATGSMGRCRAAWRPRSCCHQHARALVRCVLAPRGAWRF